MKISEETGLPELHEKYRWRVSMYNGTTLSVRLEKFSGWWIFTNWKEVKWDLVSYRSGRDTKFGVLKTCEKMYVEYFGGADWCSDLLGTYPPKKLDK